MQLLPVFRPPCCSKRPDPGQGGLKERVVMAKEKKTKTEMAGLIAGKIGVGLTFVKVMADPALGWHPLVVAPPTRAADLQERAELAAVELRELYDLAD